MHVIIFALCLFSTWLFAGQPANVTEAADAVISREASIERLQEEIAFEKKRNNEHSPSKIERNERLLATHRQYIEDYKKQFTLTPKDLGWASAKYYAFEMDYQSKRINRIEVAGAVAIEHYATEYKEHKTKFAAAKARVEAAKKTHGFTDVEINAAIAEKIAAREKKSQEDSAKAAEELRRREIEGRAKAANKQPGKARTGD